MEALTIRLAVVGLMLTCTALGWEMRVVAENKHRERARKCKKEIKLVNIDVYNR